MCPGSVKTEFTLGKGRTEQSVARSDMLDPEDVASEVLLACTESPKYTLLRFRCEQWPSPWPRPPLGDRSPLRCCSGGIPTAGDAYTAGCGG